MKKLISVFAALALVGSLAAQKGKKPAKAPAKPAVAAPAVPAAVTTAAAIAPAAKGAGKGVGLFIEGFGAYTLANGSSQAYADGNGAAQTAADSVTHKTSAAAALGGGAKIGYNLMNNLGLVASFEYRAFKTREWSSTQGNDPVVCEAANTCGQPQVSTTTVKYKKSWNNMVLGLGLRPSVDALGGSIYAGGGLAVILPFEETFEGTYTTAAGVITERKIVDKFNMGFGAYGEVGYNFNITDNIYVGLGMRAVVVTVDNNGKSRVATSTTSGTTTTTTYNYSDSLSNNDATTNTGTAADSIYKRAYKTNGVTDFSGYVTVGFRF